ncbi:MAG: cysteine desulfurase [Planctomycetes bacterium]|nr:cysteine desulfurase [Planctomycetota bacterium]
MRVYLDHNSTTPLRLEVRERWLEVVAQGLGNPSSLHASGRRARALLDEARERVAAALGVHEDEVFFTSGATEANNLALFGSLEAGASDAGLVTTTVEHASVLEPARELARRGRAVAFVPVDAQGLPDPAAVAAAVTPRTALVSVAAANNETGALPDIAGVAAELRRRAGPRPRLHSDAVQALGRVPVRPSEWGVDLASFSAHKIGGPAGVGVLWRAKGVTLAPRTHGGGQELGLRPGTESVAGVVAAALAFELAVREQAEFAARTGELARQLWADLAALLPEVRLLGPPIDSRRRLPNTLCVLLPNTDGKVLLTRLDLAGLEVSAGSACASGSIEPSHVLLALGLTRGAARSGLRLSLGRNTTASDCKLALAVFHKEFVSSRAT